MSINLRMVTSLLQVVGTVLANNSADKAMTRRIADYISLGASVLETATDAASELKQMTAKVQGFVDEKRGPTDKEFDELRARSDAAHKRIQDAAARGRTVEPSEGPEDRGSARVPTIGDTADTIPPVTETVTRRET